MVSNDMSSIKNEDQENNFQKIYIDDYIGKYIPTVSNLIIEN